MSAVEAKHHPPKPEGDAVANRTTTRAKRNDHRDDPQGNRLVGVDWSGRLTLSLRSTFFSARRTFDGTGSRRELVGLFGASS